MQTAQIVLVACVVVELIKAGDLLLSPHLKQTIQRSINAVTVLLDRTHHAIWLLDFAMRVAICVVILGTVLYLLYYSMSFFDSRVEDALGGGTMFLISMILMSALFLLTPIVVLSSLILLLGLIVWLVSFLLAGS